MAGRTVVQWDKDDCSDMRIIKVDLLGLGMLAVLKDTAYLVPQYYGVPLDYAQLPRRMQCTGDPGGRHDWLVPDREPCPDCRGPAYEAKVLPGSFDEVAIIRPGPVTGKFVNPYIQRKLGRQPVTYLHESFKPFSGEPWCADISRAGDEDRNDRREPHWRRSRRTAKAMGGKRSEAILAGMTERLREGMTTNGIDAKTQEAVLEVLSTVKEFMFPESHAHSSRHSHIPAPTRDITILRHIPVRCSTISRWGSIHQRLYSMTRSVTESRCCLSTYSSRSGSALLRS